MTAPRVLIIDDDRTLLDMLRVYLTSGGLKIEVAEDAAIACAYAQDAARQSAYDLHQFSGANGLTLEYSLHFWTYRLKALVSELGGAGTQSLRAADLAWGTA